MKNKLWTLISRMLGGGLLVGVVVAFIQYPLGDLYIVGKCKIFTCKSETLPDVQLPAGARTSAEMIKYVEHEMAVLRRTVARGGSIEHPVSAIMALTPEFYSLSFIEKITCSAQILSPLATITEPKECHFVIANMNSGDRIEIVPVNVEVCHPDVSECATGIARLTLE